MAKYNPRPPYSEGNNTSKHVVVLTEDLGLLLRGELDVLPTSGEYDSFEEADAEAKRLTS